MASSQYISCLHSGQRLTWHPADTQAGLHAGRYALFLVALVLAPVLVAAVPNLDLAKWNRAYKYEALHVPAALLKPASALYDGGSADNYVEPLFPLIGYDVQRQCKGPNAKIQAIQAKPGTCQYTVNKDGTYTYWEKQPGDWSRLSNCYCYALDVSMPVGGNLAAENVISFVQCSKAVAQQHSLWFSR